MLGSKDQFGGRNPAEFFLDFFQKSVDNRAGMCYTMYRKREEDTEMTNWYMNPELHDEEYAELAELLAEEDAEG